MWQHYKKLSAIATKEHCHDMTIDVDIQCPTIDSIFANERPLQPAGCFHFFLALISNQNSQFVLAWVVETNISRYESRTRQLLCEGREADFSVRVHGWINIPVRTITFQISNNLHIWRIHWVKFSKQYLNILL